MIVNQKVMDIPEVLQAMADVMWLMHKTIVLQHSDICRQNRNINRLNADLRKHGKLIEELKSRLAKYESHDKNSSNSSTPPLKESMKDKAIRRTRIICKSTGSVR